MAGPSNPPQIQQTMDEAIPEPYAGKQKRYIKVSEKAR
jgi:hypothetical protein